MIPPIAIRHATSADAQFAGAYLSAARIAAKIAAAEVLIAERGGARAGFLRLEFLWSTVPYIGLIRVDAEQRRQGVGTALLRFLEDGLRAAGHSALYSSSQADEPAPQAWHRHMGFVECGIIAGINEGGVGEVFFRKLLR